MSDIMLLSRVEMITMHPAQKPSDASSSLERQNVASLWSMEGSMFVSMQIGEELYY